MTLFVDKGRLRAAIALIIRRTHAQRRRYAAVNNAKAGDIVDLVSLPDKVPRVYYEIVISCPVDRGERPSCVAAGHKCSTLLETDRDTPARSDNFHQKQLDTDCDVVTIISDSYIMFRHVTQKAELYIGFRRFL